jgi:hypothetical protein
MDEMEFGIEKMSINSVLWGGVPVILKGVPAWSYGISESEELHGGFSGVYVSLNSVLMVGNWYWGSAIAHWLRKCDLGGGGGGPSGNFDSQIVDNFVLSFVEVDGALFKSSFAKRTPIHTIWIVVEGSFGSWGLVSGKGSECKSLHK